jgi:hypothetical protein
MSEPTTIPPEQLEGFARELGLTQAILVGWQPCVATHVVTWGDSLTDSAQAAQGGNAVRRALGFPETLCRALSPRVTEAIAHAEEPAQVAVRRVLAAAERWLASWHDAESRPDPDLLPEEASLYDAVTAWLEVPR